MPSIADLAGAVLSTLGMVGLVYGLVQVASEGWAHVGSLGPLAGGVVLLALFLLNEARTPQPILPLRLFASRPRAAALGARVLFLGGMIGFWFYTPSTCKACWACARCWPAWPSCPRRW